MYKIRRVYRTKPGEAANVAKLVYKQAEIFQKAGQRGEFTVSYNGYTLPGETNIVILEWQDDNIVSQADRRTMYPRKRTLSTKRLNPYLKVNISNFTRWSTHLA